eukprot:snap_masked-scaffold_94-processed-gene-0.12-mRNA-1 protein AED:1.00 eAED:1.00 QI:0/-1/0/0/-1/1/1/0/71
MLKFDNLKERVKRMEKEVFYMRRAESKNIGCRSIQEFVGSNELNDPLLNPLKEDNPYWEEPTFFESYCIIN